VVQTPLCRQNRKQFCRQLFYDRLAGALSRGAGFVSLATLAAIFIFLAALSLPLFTQGHWGEVLSATWRPFQGQYGILPMAAGSLVLSISAFVLAYPVGLGVCLFILGPRGGALRRATLGVVTFMTAIPTVVYGFVAIFLLVPLLRPLGGSGPSWLAAALTLALLILPTIVLFLHGAMRETEERTRLTSASLGFTPLQALILVVLPGSGAGLRTAAVMGYCRALSDTLIPLMLAGNAPQLPDSLFDSIRTLTAHIALVVATDNSSPAFHSLFACGLVLYGVSLAVQTVVRLRPRQSGPLGGRRLAALSFLAASPLCRALVAAWSVLSAAVTLTAVGALAVFLLRRSLPVLDMGLFFGDTPVADALLGRAPVWDGLFAACAGTVALVVLASLMAIPVGVAGGVAIHQYLKAPWAAALRFSTNALAGVPSIVMGLFGFSLIIFLRHTVAPEANTGLLLSAVCIALLVLPYTINATAQSLETLPEDLRLLGPSLGMTPWQSLRRILLPAAARGIFGGVFLSMGRAAEDTAVIILTGVVAHGGLPRGLLDKFEALPFTIYYLAAQYQSVRDLNMGFGAALTLLALTALLFCIARYLQARLEREWKH
jgi:ABC-type phosphate transport system permease subunit